MKTDVRFSQGPDTALARKLEAVLPQQLVDDPQGIPNADPETFRVDDLPLEPLCVAGDDAPCR
jgi:hypothetical protein